ncbi:DUF3108 domain-containing protein [Ideonella sp. B7]|uniref:DUF3108 domain-containing protein n=1 Tax=Ideonella benzenivorans TaxID=2831643 RepID=UPI001CECBEBD|nr:DUF3108 domain-containing protein [Ideonella benzenivorans]MCA6215454.1 DUF3108 domain-containing protein [Ideonella benzenivorans]
MRRPISVPPRHRWVLVGIVLAVLTVHGLLLGPAWRAWSVADGAPPPSAGRPVPVQLVMRPPAPPIPPTPPAPPEELPPAEPTPVQPPAETEAPAPRPAPASPPPATAEATATPADPAPPPERSGEPTVNASDDRSGSEATPFPDGPTADDAAHVLQPLPVMPPLQLVYAAQKGGATGQARLGWQPRPEGAGYRLSWSLALDGREVQSWLSQGRLGSTGVEPLRMVEQRRGRDVAAVNFQRDKDLVTFSGPSGALPMTAGAQDRASWLVQVPVLAQVMSSHWAPGRATLSLEVYTVRGEGQRWRFEVAEAVTLPGPDGQPLRCWLLRREPLMPYDSRIEVWLARDHAMVPVQLRMTPVPGDQALTLRLTDGLPPAQMPVELHP